MLPYYGKILLLTCYTAAFIPLTFFDPELFSFWCEYLTLSCPYYYHEFPVTSDVFVHPFKLEMEEELEKGIDVDADVNAAINVAINPL